MTKSDTYFRLFFDGIHSFFLFAFVCLIQRNLNTSHMFAVFMPEGFPFLSGYSASLKVGGGVWMLILLIAACKAPSCRWCSFYCCWWRTTWETVANKEGTTVLLLQIRAQQAYLHRKWSILSWVMIQTDIRIFSGNPLLIYNVFIIDKTKNPVWPKCWANNCKA